MKKSSITIIIYVLDLIFSALVSSFWDAKTGLKAIILMLWTFVFLIMLVLYGKKRF